ncbi:hypothetical protein PHYSODRAFT_317506 [Phytophthora sojae]|uniref:Uncharacterized protein n=1 Tax=Phytophthora sojae (strain P6497) TaxID=1094619 RepID=G4ZWP7_PHYSP|nr:hypothetical protein PHYSODRAFT_317506 [Phytophthora sojae]EGZ12421.1 hypothetical protein PHYSODRAFT_317506 [Phytophthora sojae]|eukprot:XP_009532754.1 hypothetical protein PHYSODRAFT_317506 [Phytophthora sojae]
MVPYVNITNQNDPDEENATPQQLQEPSSRRVKKAPITAAAQRKSANSKLSQRRRALQSTYQAANDSEKPKPPVPSLKNSLSDPIGRISRAEALSPPSSPSSLTSSEAGDSPRSIALPKATRLAKTARRFFPPKQRKPASTSPPKEESIVETKADSPRSPPKNFLKRKPYKVVFHKLDWSGVASKTDSNLSSSRSSRSHSGVSSRSTRTSRSSSRASSSSLVADNDADTEANTDTNTTSTPIFTDEDTAQRLTALETAVLERCCVAKETASLARFKYQAERKKFVATLQAQARARVQAEPEQSSSQESCEQQVSETTVTELWKTLSGDASGQIYATMLRGLTERPAKPLEPTEETG